MTLKILGSESTGNCYLLEASNEAIVIECGVKFLAVKKALKFNISNIRGLLVTHGHLDHCKYFKEYLNAGIPVYASSDCIESFNWKSNHLNPIEDEKIYTIGEFSVKPFSLKHDVRCQGFIIYHKEMGFLVFATDTHFIPYTFPGVNHFVIEANYQDEILDENIRKGMNVALRNRVINSHISLQTCKEFLMSNDLDKVKTITLIHLSYGNSHADNFRKEIECLTGKPTYIADKGMEIIL